MQPGLLLLPQLPRDPMLCSLFFFPGLLLTPHILLDPHHALPMGKTPLPGVCGCPAFSLPTASPCDLCGLQTYARQTDTATPVTWCCGSWRHNSPPHLCLAFLGGGLLVCLYLQVDSLTFGQPCPFTCHPVILQLDFTYCRPTNS